ncbi:PAS domain-containing sensor histidine kinase [Patiriisocius marinus]|uniref:PAS domain-containing sensor histidine kinase n=1 Tax=Patiriisocius marinus TaxID=1397112 RepID=UPI00232C9FE1|nr:PAS domain-containing sensor histidine kinase [Patiriisocius marinus]
MDEDKINIYKRALDREKAARKQAERILEDKSRELYSKSQELKVTNEKLEGLVREATSELKGVFENIVDAYVVMNLKADVIKMNEAAENLLGYTIADRLNLASIVHPEEREKVKEGFKTLFSKGAITDFQVNIIIANKETRLVHINAIVIYDRNNLPIAAQGIVRDITSEKAAEQQLIDSQNRLSTLILNLESGILLEDENRDIVITNKRFCDFFNIPFSPEQLIGQNCEHAAEQSKGLFQDPDEFVNRINELTSQKVQVLSDELIMNDGRILERDFIPIYEHGDYKGHLWTYRDVTLKRKYRESIEAERQKYSNIIANMKLGLIEVNNDDKILMVNQSLEEMSGYSEAELIGKKGAEVLLLEENSDIIEIENKDRLKGKSNSYEVKAKNKKGEVRYWLISGAPNYNINGQVTGSIGVHLDITELKNLEFQKELLLEKLEKSNDELQEYAHVVSHDLKSPLRSINALVNWIREDNDKTLNKDTLSNLDLIDETLEKMEQLISNILKYSSLGSDSSISENVDTNQVIEDIKTLLHIPEHISIKVEQTLPIIKADKVKIQQLFQNLISNAIRYCDKNPGLIVIDFEELKDHYQFSIKDNGIGIAQEYHNKIFKIFQSLNDHKDSSGIGLSIVKKVIDLYKGEIWLESEVGQGTTFFFTLKK